MKIKTFILTFLMMSCSIVFGQGTMTGNASNENWLKAQLADPDYGTIILANDIKLTTGNIVIPNGRTVTIDLNGNTLSTTDNSTYIINNLGKLTIKDSNESGKGKISAYGGIYNGKTYNPNVRTGFGDVNLNAKLTIESGVIEDISSDKRAVIYNYGMLYITGGKFYGKYSGITNYGMADIKNTYIECLGADNDVAAIVNDFDITFGENVYIAGEYRAVTGTAAYTGTPIFLYAELNGKKYSSLQDAIDNAIDGDVVTLIANGTEDEVLITQKADVDVTINGNNKTFTGHITIFGSGRHTGAETLTIKNVVFQAVDGKGECIASATKINGVNSYAHNVTIDGCSFKGNDTYSANHTFAIRFPSGGVGYDLTVNNCTADDKMFGLLWVTQVVGKLIVDNCTAESVKEGIVLTNTTKATITNTRIEASIVAIRAGQAGAADGTINEFTFNNNILKSNDIAIQIRGNATDANLSMTENVVSGDTHISGNTTDTKISADANYWDGNEAPVATTPIVVNSYYSDEALTNLVRIPMGNDFTAYTREDAIWGEVGGNAVESFVIKVLDAEDNVMGTTVLNNVGGIIDGSVYVTWSLKLDAESNTDEYWTMQWTTAPSIDNMPAKVELWVDGVKVSGGDVVLNAPDNLSKINAANIDVNGKILAYRTTLTEAVNNGDNVAILVAGTYNVPTGKNLTITGAVDGVQFGPIAEPHMGMKNYTFNNVTFNYAADSHYKGLQYAGDMVYNNCTFNGQVFLYGESETFNGCTFNQENSAYYNVWTYSAKEVAFNECTFNSAGKSVLIYHEGATTFNDVAVTKCEFNASQTVDGKAAIEMDSSLSGGINLTIDGETIATGFDEGNVSGSTLWNNKMNNNNDANNDITVVVDGETVLKPIYVAKIGEEGHRTLQEAIGKVENGETITLLADCDEEVTFTQTKDLSFVLDGNDKTYTGSINITARAGLDATSTLVIENFNFKTDKTSYDFISSVATNYYPNNITIQDCTFEGTSDISTEGYAVVAVRMKSANNLVIKNCTGTGLHSFLQNTAGWNLTIDNVDVYGAAEGGLALGTVQGVTVKNCEFNSGRYGIRLDGQYNNNAVIESNKINAFIPVVVRKASVDGTITFKGTNEFTQSNTDGYWCVIGTSEYKENGELPTAATAKINVTLNDTDLDREGIYGSALNGEGTEENPYLIETVNDLVFFREKVNGGNNYAGKHVKLADNIDLNNEEWTPIGNVTYDSKYKPADASKVFSGVFNGNGKVISNLKVASTVGGVDTQANVGLFGITGEGAVIKDLTLTNVNIETDGRNVGALAGFAYKATLSNITVNGNIQIKGGNNVAGVAGMTRYYDMSATNISVSGANGSAIVGNNIVGGIFAEIAPNGSEQTFKNLSVENVAITGVSGVGGIVGLLTTGTVENVSVKNVALTGRTDYQGNAMGRIRLGSVAGLMGGKYATIANEVIDNVTAKNLDGNAVVLPIIGANYDASSNATEAKIGDTYYATLQIAIKEAEDGATITLIDDFSLTAQNAQELFKPAYNRESYCGIYIPDDKAIVLDLNGHTVSYVDTYGDIDNVMILNLGNLTINDENNEGKITYKPVAGASTYSKFYSTIFNCGTLTINGGTIENTCETETDVTNAVDNHSRLSHEYDNDCILTVNGGTLNGAYYYAIRQYTHYFEGVQNRVTINNGNINGGIYMQHGDSWYYADPNKNRLNVDCYLTINGGNIDYNTTPDKFGKIKSRLNNPDNNAFGLEITGGNINVPVELLVQRGYYYANGVSGETVPTEAAGTRNAEWLAKNGGFIEGGTFATVGDVNDVTSNLASFVAAGYQLKENVDSTYGVSLADYVTFPEGVTAENYKEKFGDNTVTDGTNYYATMTAALNAVYGTETTLYCKPGANVGQMTHGAIKETLTVYGNDAYTSGNGDFDIGNCNYEGKEITSDITLTVKHLDGCGAWGYKNTEHTINIVFENCKDMSEVYLSGTAGRTNITMTNCEFTDNVDGGNCKVYSNADGTITLKDMLFSGVDKAVNFNHKATGTQTIALENCTFTNCGDDVAGDEIPVRVLSSVAGGNSVLTVTDCTFTGTPEGGADILLDYGVGLTEATVSNTAAKVVVEKENNVGETTIVAANETKSFVNLVPVAKIGDAVYYTFEDAIAAAVTDASITSIEILRDYTQTYYIEAGKTYSILENQNLTVVAPEGKSYTITLDRTIGKTFSIYQKSANSSLTIADNVTIEGLEILANGFATSGNNTNINGTLKAMSLKQWTSDGTITVSETGKVWLGYGDGQFDLAYGNGAVVINGNGDKTEAQFKAGYSGTRGNGNTLTLNDTYFEAGAWFNLNGSNGTININNSLLKVSGGDAAGKMTIKAGNVVYVNEGGTLECANITLEEGAKIVVNGGTLKAKTVTNNGEIAVLGESTLNIETHTGENIDFLDGAIVNNSTVGGEAFVAGNVTFRGANTFVMLYDYGTLTDYYGTTAPMKWNVEKGASVTLTNKARYGLGYGDEVTVIGNIENALTARENLSDDDRSLFMHGLVAQESSGWNCNSKLIVENAYVVLGSNNSFGNKPENYGGNYTINFKNSVVDASRITFYEALSTTTFTFEGSDVKMGTFMTRDADSKFTLKDSKVLSTTTTNGTDEGNYNAGELVLENSSLTYSAAVINTGTIEIGAASTLTAPAVTNEGTINFTALDSKLVTATEGLTIKLDEAYPDHKVVYKDVAYVVVEKVYVAKIGEQGYESLAEALDAVENGETIELLGTEGSEISKEIDFTEDIEFTITGNAPNYGLPIVTFQNATVNIKDATILIPELDARQDATINVINSTVYDAGGNSIAKSYYNGAINISGTSEVYMMQVTTMGYINISGTAKLHATWQTNVYGNGLITLNEGATFNTAALQLTAKDYSGRDNTDADRVGQPAEIVVNGATLNVGKVQSSNGADYSYHSSYGINVGTIEGKSAILNIINGGTVNYFMKDGETANIGAGGTVNVNASTFNVACRAENGTVTLANAGTINVENATVEIAKLDNDNLLFISGENTFKVEDATGSSYALRAKDGVVFNNSYVKGTANETIRLLGSATFNGGFECAYLQGQKVIEDNPLNGGIGGTIAIEEGTTVHATYGVEISNDYTLNGGNIELSGGNADGDLWGFVFQNSECTINSNIKVVGNTGTYAPIHFTNVTATVNGNISQSNSGGEVIYIKNSEVTFAENSNVTTTTGVHVNDGSTLTNRGEINGNVTVNSTLLSENNITGTIVKAATATIQLTGGIYTTEPEDSWCAENYDAFPYDENSWVVRQISGEQTFNLVAGWNWVSSYITEFKEETGLAMLQIGLGTNGIQIKNDNYTSNYRNGSWGGGLKSVSVEEMYKVNMSDDVNFKFEGSFVNYDECEIVLRPGWNYIGYPVNVETNLADALVILSADGQEESNGAKVGDVIKSQLGSATYIGSSTWLFTNSFNLVPGEGYMYYNSSDEVKILRYTTKKATTTSEANTRSSKHWIVDATQYPSNMTMIAMTDVEGGNYEVAAFVKGEVRGSSRPVYVESLDAYILILTISGDDVEEMTFKCYDLTTDEEVEFSNRINYSNDAIVGSIYEPYMLTRGTTGIGEAAMSNVNIYPNPTTTGTEINLEATCDKVEVFNALGVKVVEYQNVDSIDALETAGIYVIRITNNGNVQNCRLVVK